SALRGGTGLRQCPAYYALRQRQLANCLVQVGFSRILSQQGAPHVTILGAVVAQVVKVLDTCQVKSIARETMRLGNGRAKEQAIDLGPLLFQVAFHPVANRGGSGNDSAA